MVLLAAAVCAKSGKAIISRQFVEMTKSRIEGLLAAFPKLLGTGKQHTFVETESVRYVYQPLEKLYMLLITTKASNILEDLETLRLFSRVIPEYCKAMEEVEIVDNSFNLIFAFDEIVALGYRESVNLAQIRTFVEMDSHEEKVYQAVRQTQEREAKNKMREKAKELQRARQEATKKGPKSPGFGSTGFGGGSGNYNSTSPVSETSPTEPIKTSYAPPSKLVSTGKAMKLRTDHKDVDSFVDQLKQEGERVVAVNTGSKVNKGPVATTPVIDHEIVHLRMEEKLTLTARRDGSLQNMELHGLITLRITDDSMGRIRIQIDNQDNKGIQLQAHPNIDKELFKDRQLIGLKNPAKPFPINSDVGVLKWRFQTQNEALMPLSINCWPSENGRGGCDVNIEYDLQLETMELDDILISIPLASGSGNLVVGDCDGEYYHDSKKNFLEWRLPVIDRTCKTGAMEFSCNGHPDDFFPVTVNFISRKPYSDLRVMSVYPVDSSSPVLYSNETVLTVERYEVV